MGMRVTIQINGHTISVLDLVRTKIGEPQPFGVGHGDYTATMYTFEETPPNRDPLKPADRWTVLGHDRSTGVWGLVADALAQRPS